MPKALGYSSPVKIRAANPQGVRGIRAWVEQNGSRYDLIDKSYPGSMMDWVRKDRTPVEIEFTVGKDRAPGLAAGKAKLILEAEANNLRGVKSRLVQELPVVLGKPKIEVLKDPVFLRRGGTGVVVFRAGGDWSEAGVKVGTYVFPSYPSQGDANRRIALFGYPPDVPRDATPVLYATNLAGDEVTEPFPHHITAVEFREREVKIAEPFLERVVPAVDTSGQGALWERFQRVNSKIRRENDSFLASLKEKSSAMPIWTGAFLLLPRSANQAQFADFRTYKYQGKELNREWHLGVDLASVKNAPVPAPNAGKVVFAGTLGIYGKCVVIDHGLRVQSVYGHMSQLDVKEGDVVSKGQKMGNTGMTGLAGGDHAHIGLLLNGVFVDPVEWSLPKWMDKSVTPAVSSIAAGASGR
ncbi:peptidase M24 [Bryobacterales bacterium F-183]|nr:peptidase M24 [Bryobacterales bacterium F-183]